MDSRGGNQPSRARPGERTPCIAQGTSRTSFTPSLLKVYGVPERCVSFRWRARRSISMGPRKKKQATLRPVRSRRRSRRNVDYAAWANQKCSASNVAARLETPARPKFLRLGSGPNIQRRVVRRLDRNYWCSSEGSCRSIFRTSCEGRIDSSATSIADLESGLLDDHPLCVRKYVEVIYIMDIFPLLRHG
jgi:hypothetical protein